MSAAEEMVQSLELIPDLDPAKKKKELDDWLNQVDYAYLSSSDYVPSEFALEFALFIKLVNGEEGESHKTPPVHLAMLDKVVYGKPFVANLCARGIGKTTLMAEYLILFLAVFGELPGFGKIEAMIYVSDSMENGAKSLRKNLESRYENSDFLKEWIAEATFTDPYIEFRNKHGGKLGVRLYGAKSGVRGTKIFAKRPVLAILDDLLGDEGAESPAQMKAIENTVYKGVMFALDPSRRKIIFNGTPFNKEDILVKAVESGAWDVNVWPICEKFPCTREEFRGAWPDRFSYEYVKEQYDLAEAEGKVATFNGELMLRLTSEEDRLVQDGEIRWYKRSKLLANRHYFNFYITTDFATSEKQTADFTVISVWAYNSNGDWFWVDGICTRQSMAKTVDDLFRLVQEYQPQQVGMEISGQQGGFISWFQREMFDRNIWFNFASSEKSGAPGIRPASDKLSRFQLVVPWFKAGKVYLPEEMKETAIMQEFVREIRLATSSGLKGKDDCIDTISMLGYLKPWKPAEGSTSPVEGANIWDDVAPPDEPNALSSYIV